MYIPPFYYVGQVNKIFIYLTRYLNEILKLNPPMVEKKIFDKELNDAVMKFRTFYNSRNPQKRLPIQPGIQNEVWGAIGEMLGSIRLQQELRNIKDPLLEKLLQGIQPIIIPPYTMELAECDKKLARIFGGIGAIAKGSGHDIGGSYRGETGIKGDNEAHLDRKMHLYGSEDGLKYTEVYMPENGVYIGKNPNSDEDSYMFYYQRLGKVYNVTIFFSHIANFIKPQIGQVFNQRTKIGEIGGKGGVSGEKPPYTYIHAHLAIHRGKGFTGILVPFSDVFC